jgi:hypothetical protein
MREDTMKSKTIIADRRRGACLGWPMNASAATVDILENTGDQSNPTGTVKDFIGTPSIVQIPEFDAASRPNSTLSLAEQAWPA